MIIPNHKARISTAIQLIGWTTFCSWLFQDVASKGLIHPVLGTVLVGGTIFIVCELVDLYKESK